METHIYSAFIIATALMIAMPGPSVLLTVAHSITYGWKNALATVSGTTVGIAVQLIIAAIGLTSLLHLASEAFTWLRWAGAIYLVYLGVKQWRSANASPGFDTEPVTRRNLFLQGLIVTIPNPKSLIFIAAFLPQFIDASRPIAPQVSLIIPTFLAITFIVTSAWALAAGNARTFLHKKEAVRSVFRATGGLMIMAGLGLAMARRGS